MDCKTFERRLESYLAGDLTSVERAEMKGLKSPALAVKR